MRILACVGALALLVVAQSALAAPSSDDSADSGKSAGAASADQAASDTGASNDQADNAGDSSKSDKHPDKSASGGDKGKTDDEENHVAPTYGHGRQFGLRAGIVGGYNMDFRYNSSPFCAVPKPNKAAKDQVKFCGHGAPFAVDLGLSFAPLDSIEPFLWGRFGFTRETETDTNPLVLVGAGARIYTMSDSAFKVFIEPAVAWELEGGGNKQNWQQDFAGYHPDYKQDIDFHVAAGPQYDLAKNVGIYLDAGLTVGILRSIHSTMELQAGVQARLP